MNSVGLAWVGVVGLAAAVLDLFPATAEAASVTIAAGETYDLAADLVLSAGDSLDANGTTDKPCVIAGHGHAIVANGVTGHIKIENCIVSGAGGTTDKTPAMNLSVSGSGDVTFTRVVFDASGSMRLHMSGSSTAHITGCLFKENGISYIQDELVGSNYVSAFFADGSSAGEKVFQGNRVYRSSVSFENVNNWLIGGYGDQYSNVVVGHRGIITALGNHIKVVGNFINPLYPLTSPDVENLVVNGPSDAHDLIVEHNVVRSGEWVLRGCRGEVRYNVIADMNGHAWIKGPTECNIHHNIFVNYDNPDHNSEGGIDVVYLTPNLNIFNNTFDGGGKIGRLGVPAIHAKKGRVIERVHSNAFTNLLVAQNFAAISNLGPDTYDDTPPPGDARMHYADYNLFWSPDSPSQVDYNLPVEPDDKTPLAKGADGFAKHDVKADPAFKGPLPVAFPYASTDVQAGTVTVSTILMRYRDLYTPGAQSPLVGGGDPMGGASNNIGAIGQGSTKDPADQFGSFKPGMNGPPPIMTGSGGSGVTGTGGDGVGGAGGAGGGSDVGTGGTVPRGNLTGGSGCSCTTGGARNSHVALGLFTFVGWMALRRRRRVW